MTPQTDNRNGATAYLRNDEEDIFVLLESSEDEESPLAADSPPLIDSHVPRLKNPSSVSSFFLSTIFKEDWDSFINACSEQEFLNTESIYWYFKIMLNCIRYRVLCLSPECCNDHKIKFFNSPSHFSFELTQSEMPLSNYFVCLLPIWSPRTNHISLLVWYSKTTIDDDDNNGGIFYHYDSLKGLNHQIALDVSKRIQLVNGCGTIPLASSGSRGGGGSNHEDYPPMFSEEDTEIRFVEEKYTPQQYGSWECGFYTLFVGQSIIERASRGVYHPLRFSNPKNDSDNDNHKETHNKKKGSTSNTSKSNGNNDDSCATSNDDDGNEEEHNNKTTIKKETSSSHSQSLPSESLPSSSAATNDTSESSSSIKGEIKLTGKRAHSSKRHKNTPLLKTTKRRKPDPSESSTTTSRREIAKEKKKRENLLKSEKRRKEYFYRVLRLRRIIGEQIKILTTVRTQVLQQRQQDTIETPLLPLVNDVTAKQVYDFINCETLSPDVMEHLLRRLSLVDSEGSPIHVDVIALPSHSEATSFNSQKILESHCVKRFFNSVYHLKRKMATDDSVSKLMYSMVVLVFYDRDTSNYSFAILDNNQRKSSVKCYLYTFSEERLGSRLTKSVLIRYCKVYSQILKPRSKLTFGYAFAPNNNNSAESGIELVEDLFTRQLLCFWSSLWCIRNSSRISHENLYQDFYRHLTDSTNNRSFSNKMIKSSVIQLSSRIMVDSVLLDATWLPMYIVQSSPLEEATDSRTPPLLRLEIHIAPHHHKTIPKYSNQTWLSLRDLSNIDDFSIHSESTIISDKYFASVPSRIAIDGTTLSSRELYQLLALSDATPSSFDSDEVTKLYFNISNNNNGSNNSTPTR